MSVANATGYTFYTRYLSPSDAEDTDTFEFAKTETVSDPQTLESDHYWVFHGALSNVEDTTDDDLALSYDAASHDSDHFPPEPIVDDGIF